VNLAEEKIQTPDVLEARLKTSSAAARRVNNILFIFAWQLIYNTFSVVLKTPVTDIFHSFRIGPGPGLCT